MLSLPNFGLVYAQALFDHFLLEDQVMSNPWWLMGKTIKERNVINTCFVSYKLKQRAEVIL